MATNTTPRATGRPTVSNVQTTATATAQQVGQVARPKRDLIQTLESAAFALSLKSLLKTDAETTRFIRVVMNAMRKNERLAKCTPDSFIGAVMMAAAFNLEPNTPLQLCHIIPYGKKKLVDGKWIDGDVEAQFQVGYRGYIEMAYRLPNMVSMQAENVFRNDTFVRKLGSNSLLDFERARGARGEQEGAFCFTKFINDRGHVGETSTYMDLEEIFKIRDNSQSEQQLKKNLSYAKGAEIAKAQKKLDESPWRAWRERMILKTVIIRHFKTFPLSPEIRAAVVLEDRADGGGLDLGQFNDATLAKDFVNGNTDMIDGEAKEVDGDGDDQQTQNAAQQQTQTQDKPADQQQNIQTGDPRDEPPIDDNFDGGNLFQGS